MFFAVAACTASGSDDQAHGPVFGANEGGAGDGGGRLDGGLTQGDGAARGDGALPPPPPPPPPPSDGGQDSGGQDSGAQDAGQDSGGQDSGGGCTDTTAVLSASATSLYESAATGTGGFTTTTVSGTYRGGAQLVAFGGGFVGTIVGASDAIQFTKWTGGTWSGLAPIGAATGAPALATVSATEVDLVYRGLDGKYYFGKYISNAWDAANGAVGGSAAQSFGPTAVGLAGVGGAALMAHAGGNNTNLYAEGLAAGSAAQIGAAQTQTLVPAVIATSGANDAMVVYVHSGDFKVSWATRASGVWTDRGAIDATLFTGTGVPVAAAPLGGGKAVIVFQGSDGKGYAVTFDGTNWVLPAVNLGGGVALSGLPVVAPGACGDDAIAALPASGSGVKVVRLSGGAWSAAEDVASTTGATVAAIATTK